MIAILDFGSQYSQLIARRIRECKVYCELLPFDINPEKLAKKNPQAIILSGGPASVTAVSRPLCEKEIFNLGVPVLGICYGMQLMAEILGGKVIISTQREFGKAILTVDHPGELFSQLSTNLDIWMSHSDRISILPPGFSATAHTSNSPVAVMENRKRKLYGLQFHPEVIHTPKGKKILKNFLFKISGCSPTWTSASFIKHQIEAIKRKVGREQIISALSGGVDSSVLSVLLHKAIGDQLISVFVNNGLLRKNEPRMVRETFKNYYHLNIRYVDAQERFLKKLKGVLDPEKKRKVIGHEFIEIFEEEAKKSGKVKYLAQGTLYPDVIESRSSFGGPSATIKSHHNVGGLPDKMGMDLIEPFKNLYKDEVRIIGKKLGLTEDIIQRQPFPGPGLAVRIVGEVTEERLEVLKEADHIVNQEIKGHRIYKNIWQSFAVLLPIKNVGVMGDERTYEEVIAIRAISSIDGMTADWVKLPYSLMDKISRRIINEVKGINRVVYDISSKPPSTIEWE